MSSHAQLPVDRRAFCRTGLLAVGAVVSQPLASLLGAGVPVGTGAANVALARFVLSYASAYFQQGGGVLGTATGTAVADVHLVAQLGPINLFANAWQSDAPATPVYADGNFLSFTNARGQFVAVENLQPADYAARQQNLAAGANIQFAHEALTYTPATASYGDPFGAMAHPTARRLQILPGAATADPVVTVLHGLVAAARFGLTTDRAFAALQDQTFAAPATTPQTGSQTAAAFVAVSPALANLGASDAIASLLATPLLESSLTAAHGITASGVVPKYQRLRARTDGGISNGAVWLAALLGNLLHQGTTGLVVTDADPFVASQARTALAQARGLTFL